MIDEGIGGEQGEHGGNPLLSIFRDQAIEADIADQFSRGKFIDGILSSIVHDGRSTGITVGIVGKWGEGKTSVLNILRKRIEEREGSAVVVSFNPWVVAHRDDLIAAFFKALIAAISNKHEMAIHSIRRSQIAEEVGKLIALYGAAITPLLTHYQPGSSWIVKAFFKLFGGMLDAWVKRKKTPERLKASIEDLLGELAVPIVVLIDEVDRVEDDDVRVLAQLVRAVADFRSVSYVLAYDEKRVSEALGAGAVTPAEREERGKRYLEKIVQVPVPLPVIFDDELQAILKAGLAAVVRRHNLDEGKFFGQRYEELVSILIPEEISNARDVYRLISNFAVRIQFVVGEVDPVDVLGFVVLQLRAPGMASYVRKYPHRFVYDGTDLSFYFSVEKKTDDEVFEKVCESPAEQRAPVKELVTFLFPGLPKQGSSRAVDRSRVAYLRSLMMLLRMGLLPAALPRMELWEILSSSDIDQRIRALAEQGRLESFMVRVSELYNELKFDEEKYWVALFLALEAMPNESWRDKYSRKLLMRAAVDEIVSVASKNPDFSPKFRSIVLELVKQGKLISAANIVRRVKNSDKMYVWNEDLKYLYLKIATEIHTGNNIDPLPPQFVFLLSDLERWTDELRAREATQYLFSPASLDLLVFELFGGQYSSDSSTVTKFMPVKDFINAIRQRLPFVKNDQADTLLTSAYEKAFEELGAESYPKS